MDRSSDTQAFHFKLSSLILLLLTSVYYIHACTYDVNVPVNPDSTCTSLTVKNIPRDADLFVPDLSHVTSVTFLAIQNTGITTLPDIGPMEATVRTFRLFDNKLLTTIPIEILKELQQMRTFIISFNNVLTVLPDVYLRSLRKLQFFRSYFTSIPYLPEMGKTITVSTQPWKTYKFSTSKKFI